VTITDLEVREAIRAWMEDRGIPNAVVEKLRIERPSVNDKNVWSAVDQLRVRVEYDVDRMTAHMAVEPKDPK